MEQEALYCFSSLSETYSFINSFFTVNQHNCVTFTSKQYLNVHFIMKQLNLLYFHYTFCSISYEYQK